MIPYDPEETFICSDCGKVAKIYYSSNNNPDICVFCDTEDDYDDSYYEDDSESPWNE
jgi:hypothetical protein